MANQPHSVRPVLSFLDKAGHRASEERFRLLYEIGRQGSISAAAKSLGISYKAAWDAVNALNNLFSTPLVNAKPGGRKGGRAVLTEEGRRALQAHRHLTIRLNQFIAEIEQELSGNPGAAPLSNPLLWSFAMRTSARNVFHGIVEEITPGAVNSEVLLRVSDRTVLTTVITNTSIESLELRKGSEAFALIKASTPILMAETEAVKLSARNQIHGNVISVAPGAVNCEVQLDIGNSKTLTVVITMQSAQSLEIKPGDRMCAMFKASQIILGVE
ncbi:TOBE domain-containing protein [uncultured Cohaesibacter sp.]|uniref:TOBE domain-containing protein n=1 Tax=uncultured Cohaesibacter sp. TaxID=1002546 RepID=UPI0029310435|nr:TOBE domain-containing protein [uncultured Cohaesibacter sp.]